MGDGAAKPHVILMVDDEPLVLAALTRLLRRTGHELVTCESGAAALEVLAKRTVSVIISDHRMPGMTGVEFLAKARDIQPDAARIILTGFTDFETAQDAINRAGVTQFLPKPWDDAMLVSIVQNAVRHLDLAHETERLSVQVNEQNLQLKALTKGLEREVGLRTAELQASLEQAKKLNQLLERQNIDVVKSLAGVLALVDENIAAHSRRMARFVPPVCARLGVKKGSQVQRLVISALLHDIGKLGLRPELRNLCQDAAEGDLRAEVAKHIVIGQGQIQIVEGLTDIGLTIRCHHENFDGTGLPDQLKGNVIPLGARILRVLDAYDHLITEKGEKFSPVAMKEFSLHAGTRFDPAVVDALAAVLEQQISAPLKTVSVQLSDLREGMVLAQDIHTENGVLVVHGGEPLTAGHLEKVRNYKKIFPLPTTVLTYTK
jgi:response regulator RpfG family c-di-GMP phosphodiesterase